MSEQRLMDLERIEKVLHQLEVEFKDQPDKFEALKLVKNVYEVIVDMYPPISPEMLPIVQELRTKLARYEQAEVDGRLAICPEKLYDLMFDECSPEEAYISEYRTEGLFIKFAGDYIALEEIGKTVFLTHEAAEAMLKEREQ